MQKFIFNYRLARYAAATVRTMCYKSENEINFTHGKREEGSAPAPSGKTVKLSCRDAIRTAMDDEMTRDPRVFLIGEEVAQYQGAYKVSKGLVEKFGSKRVVDTPISESGFTGIGVGAAEAGLRPIVEFMTFNFALQAIDHIINSTAKTLYMSAGELRTPIVFRGLNGAAAGVAAQHSECFASLYGEIPGLTVLTPYDVLDYRGLLKAAIRTDDPVVFLENEIMYNEEFTVPEEVTGMDFLLPIGKARVMKEGKDVTIVSYALGVKHSLEAAEALEKEGISAEVINLNSIRPLDRRTIVESVKKTNRIVTVEEGWPESGIGAEICALFMESEGFDYLDAPVERITGLDVPMAYAISLEVLALPKAKNIINGVHRVLKGVKKNK